MRSNSSRSGPDIDRAARSASRTRAHRPRAPRWRGVIAGCVALAGVTWQAPDAAATITDQAHASSGSTGFFFLEPMVEHSATVGDFVPYLPVYVEIDAYAPGAPEAMSLHKIITQVERHQTQYLANWSTAGLDTSLRYRVRIRYDGRDLGWADVMLVNTEAEKAAVDRSQFAVAIKGETLPIRFFINPCGPVLCTALDACHVAGECQLPPPHQAGQPFQLGACTQPAAPDGTPCPQSCLEGATCQAGACAGGSPLSCPDESCAVACTPGSDEPSACGAAACIQRDGTNNGCCSLPPDIARASTPQPGGTCVSYALSRNKGQGPPNEQTFTFDVPCGTNPEDTYTLVVDATYPNDNKHSDHAKAKVSVNGAVIFSENDFAHTAHLADTPKTHLERAVTLATGTNTITLRLHANNGLHVAAAIRKAPFKIAVDTPLPAQCFNYLPDAGGTTTDSCTDVTANGVPGVVANGALAVFSVPLVESRQADLLVQSTDWCGNVATDDRKVVYDVTLPAITIEGFTDGEYRNHDVTPTWSVTDANLVQEACTLTLTTGDAYLPPGPADVTTSAAFTRGDTQSADGDYVISAAAADCATNESTLSKRFTIDKTPPRITLSGVTNGQQVRDTTVTPTFAVADRNLVSSSASLSFTPSGSTAAQTSAFTSGTTLSEAGLYVLTVQATDRAGNVSTRVVHFNIAICGNDFIEPGEQCERGACCAACNYLPDNAACTSLDQCNTGTICTAGVCGGGTPNGTCVSTQLDVAVNSATSQSWSAGGMDIGMEAGTAVTLNGAPVQGTLPVTVDQLDTTQVDFRPPGMPLNVLPVSVLKLGPSGAQFSPPLVFSAYFDPEVVNRPVAWLCDDTGEYCEEAAGTRSDVEVNGVPKTKLDVPVAHFSYFVMGHKIEAASWMTDMHARIKDLKLRDIFIPGTHDSGAYAFESDDQGNICSAKTQGSNFTEQLRQGVRFFDIRVKHDASTSRYHIYHGFYPLTDNEIETKDDVSVLLDVVNNFMASTKEIVIIEFSHFSDFADDAAKDAFIAWVISKFPSEWLINAGDADNKIGDLVASCPRVLVNVTNWGTFNATDGIVRCGINDDGSVCANGAFKMQSHYFKKGSSDEFYSAGKKEVYETAHPGLWVLQAILTKGTQCVYYYNDWFRDNLTSDLNEWQDYVNIVIVDYVNLLDGESRWNGTVSKHVTGIDFVGTAIRANARRHALPGGTFGASCGGCRAESDMLRCKSCTSPNGNQTDRWVRLPCDTVNTVDGQLVCQCDNNTQDGDETDVDCGGSCSRCADSKTCKVNSDCMSNKCNSKTKKCSSSSSSSPTVPQCAVAYSQSNYSTSSDFQSIDDGSTLVPLSHPVNSITVKPGCQVSFLVSIATPAESFTGNQADMTAWPDVQNAVAASCSCMPSGPYSDTCWGCQASGTTLNCSSCAKPDGSDHDSHLDFAGCQEPIHNCDGWLTCGACCATLYEHIDGGGETMSVSDSNSSELSGIWNDRVSSIDVKGTCELSAYPDAGRGGEPSRYTGYTSDVGPSKNDTFSSVKCTCPPPGSYADSCEQGSCKIADGKLDCMCKKFSGALVSTTLSLPCTSDVANCWGKLTCGSCGATPAGSYTSSCPDCSVSGDTLTCTCKKFDGTMSPATTSIDAFCSGDIANCNGTLKCGGC